MTAAERGTAVSGTSDALSPPPVTAAAARARVRDVLDGLPAPLPATVTNDILLITSELVTNAIRHGGGLTAFRAAPEARALRIAVTDRSPAPPVVREPGDGRNGVPGGFGWPLVQRLSRSVTITPAPPGKTIEAVVAYEPPAG
ncbi:ATP-binding protein [Streptomyces sp. JHA26]|uniref:ATP-binding protein n=1 Tax=Streptomyces sp. JHA26 TaxID=1917143 RepID=UPI00209AEBF5|nr:ATP-binding protein [Streptomyces sp. JHA26]